MVHSRRNVTKFVIFRYQVVPLTGERFVIFTESVVTTGYGGSSVTWLIFRLNRSVGVFRLKFRQSLVGSKQGNRLCGQRFVAGDTASHLTWPAMCTQNRGSRCVQHCRVEVNNFPNCTTKFRATDMRLVQCREQRLTSLVLCGASRADLK